MLVAILTLTHHAERFFSPALVYLAMGAAGAVALGLSGAPWPTISGDIEVVEHVAEATTVMALFAAGLRIDHDLRLREWRATVLLLALVMPLTIVAVAAIGAWGLGLSAGAAVVLGAALAPTDPVLAGDLGVAAPGEGDRSEAAFALTSEAGLNDGLAFPFVFLGLVIAAGADGGAVAEWLAWDVAWPIAGGIAVGVAVGWGVAAAAVRLRDRGMLAEALDGWAAVGAVLAVYGLAEIAGTYGFLAAFAGGIAFRRYERDHEYQDGVHDGAEAMERALELATILLVGSLLTADGLRIAGWEAVALALALIVVIRPVLTVLAVRGTPLDPRARLYVGIFGIRGVGSIYYAAAVLASGLLAPDEGRLVMWTVVVVVAVSIVVHGLSAAALTRRLVPADVIAHNGGREPPRA